jgi:hypothetical protein
MASELGETNFHQHEKPDKPAESMDQAKNGEPVPESAEDLVLNHPPSGPRDSQSGRSQIDQGSRTRLTNGLQQNYGNAFVQRIISKQKGLQNSVNDSNMAQHIQAASSTGTNLDGSVQRRLEKGLGADLSSVKIHNDSEADHLARSVDSLAFTAGQHIFFKSGTYDPDSQEGLHLLAHEATHTIQQSSGPVDGTPTEGEVAISNPSDRFEQAADTQANNIITGNATIQREKAPEEEEKIQARRTGAVIAPVQREKSPEEEEEKIQTRREGAPAIAVQKNGKAPPANAPGSGSGDTDQAFFNKTVEANSQIALAAGKYSAWLSSITIPYATAWSSHQTAMKAAGEAAKAANALVLAVVFGALPEGAIASGVGRAMNKLALGEKLTDNVADKLTKGGMKRLEQAAEPEGTEAFKKMPTDPLVMQNQANLRAETEVLNPARAVVLSWQHAINTKDPNLETDFDPVGLVKSSLTMDGKSLLELPAPDADLQHSYERGFLQDWINSEAYEAYVQNSQFSWGKASDKLIAYGKSIGMADVSERLHTAVGAGLTENNERAIKSGHGLI